MTIYGGSIMDQIATIMRMIKQSLFADIEQHLLLLLCLQYRIGVITGWKNVINKPYSLGEP